MLIVEDSTHFEAVVAYAKTIGLYDGDDNGCLKNRLDYLAHYGRDDRTRVRLYRDFAPHSFGFVVEESRGNDWAHVFTGGLIFHGRHDGGGSGAAPTFAVSVSTTTGWAIHT